MRDALHLTKSANFGRRSLCDGRSYRYEKAGYEASGSLLIAFFSIGFRAPRALIQAMF
jgi:hypothetical protein